ncbi:MAG: tubulin-like doman-containing protein [Candidatus Bathyarchaeia archaeon]
MPRNVLLIGLGGTGVWAATYLKRDLIQTYGEVPEKNVRIICFDTISLDPDKVERMKREHLVKEDYGLPSIGGVALEAGKEYFYVGGDAQPICRELQEDITGKSHPTIRSWLQFDWYLRNLPPAQMDLDAGASWRQFGRLTVFLNEEKVYGALQNAVQSFPANQHLDIVIVSSLAGGTGSGMFLDIAFLARQFAEKHIQQGAGYTIFGIFAMPSTFDATGADRTSLRRNCFAAWRTLDRFLRTSGRQYEIRHPSYTHTYELALLDYCALVGGLRQQDSLHTVRPEFGVFPSISDFLFAMIDDKVGDDLSQLIFRNSGRTEQALNAPLRDWEKRRYCFSFGTYAYVYPSDDIVEELTLRFAKELLDSYFLRQIKVSGTGKGRTYELESLREPLTYRDDFCKNPGDTDLQRFLSPLPEVALYNPGMAKGFTIESMVAMLRNYDSHTPPEQQQKDEEIISRRVWAKPSKVYGDDLVAGANRIPNEVEGYKAVHLGHLVDPITNLRLQGEFQGVLDRYSARLKERFALALGRRVVELLNGTANPSLTADQRVLEGENLCLAVFFVERLIIDIFQPFIEACKEAQKMVLKQYAHQKVVVERVHKDMQDARHATWLTPIPIISYLRAHNLQYAYIAAEQELIDIECRYHCLEALIKTTENFIEIANRVLEELRRWKRILVDDLYDDILSRLDAHRVMRQTLKQIRVREYLSDEEHEEQLYQQYRNSPTSRSHNIPPMDDALNSLRWRETGSWLDVTGRLELVRYDGTSNNEIATFKDDKHHNSEILLNMVSPYFEPIRDQTVLDRLASRFARGADFVSSDVIRKASPMNMAQGQNPGITIAMPSPQTPQQQEFRGTGQPNPNNPQTVQDEIARLDQGTGNYILRDLANRQVTLVIQVVMGIRGEEAINAEPEAGKAPSSLYDEFSPKSILHLFPAEINATDYEARLQDIGEAYRHLHPEVIILLGDKSRFEAFALAYLFEFVKETQITENGNRVWTYMLDCGDEKYRLTRSTHPQDYLSLILEAASNFVLGRDAIDRNKIFDPALVLERCYQFMDDQTQGRPYRQLQWLEEKSQKLNGLRVQQDRRLKDLAAVIHLKLKEIEDNIRRKMGDLAELLRHMDELKSFCFAWLYGLVKIVRERIDSNGNPVFDWILEIDGQRWWLNHQGHRSDPWAIFLPAVKQFVIENRCAQSGGSIDVPRVNQEWQNRVQNLNAVDFENDVKERLQRVKMRAQSAPQDVKTLLEVFEEIVEEEIRIRREAERVLTGWGAPSQP